MSTPSVIAAAEQLVNALEKPRRSYIERFVKLRCAPDLLAWGVYPNAKEITESTAAYEAARNKLELDPQNPSIDIVCVGDGRTPRTGAMFAARSAWTVSSIDPLMRQDGPWSGKVNRLHTYTCRIEDAPWYALRGIRHAVVVAVHSHARLPETLAKLLHVDRVDVIAIPCCVDQSIGRAPDFEYEDEGIWSPRRTVKVWRNI